jgi:capsular polysaccharide biosynthesis protein
LYKEKIYFTNRKIDPKNYIFISRSKAQYRKIENENDVVEIFKKYNFQVYFLEELSLLEQINLFKNAKIIAGLHGAGFTNMIFSEENTVIFELYSHYYHDAGMRLHAHTLKMKYYYLIGDKVKNHDVHPQKEDTLINLEILDYSLNKIFKENVQLYDYQ